MTYRIFGLLLDSDVPLPELRRVRRSSPDILVRLRPPARIARGWEWIDRWDRLDGGPWLRIGRREDAWLLRFSALADFVVPAHEGAITCKPAPGVPPRTLRHLLLDQAVPLALSARGHVLLHASAVSTGGGALLLAGESGSGKSTLAFALSSAGYRLLSDDVVRIVAQGLERPVLATPAYPGARLWPDVLDAFRVGARGRRLAHYSQKRRVSRRAVTSGRPVPVTCVYLLEAGSAPRICELPARAALVALLKQTYRMDAGDARLERRHFDTLATLCATVRVRRLAYPHDFDSVADVVRVVVSELTADS